jgi:hypothetical protein
LGLLGSACWLRIAAHGTSAMTAYATVTASAFCLSGGRRDVRQASLATLAHARPAVSCQLPTPQ